MFMHPIHKTGFCGFLVTKFQGRLAHGLDTKTKQELALALTEEQERVQQTPGEDPASLVFSDDHGTAAVAAQV